MIRVQVQDGLSQKLLAFVRSLSPSGRRVLEEGASAELYALVRAHFRDYARTHHDTATRLGAIQTGHWEEAASAMVHGVDDGGAFVELKAPGIGRAVRPIQIRPDIAKALTIPLHAISYGRRVAEVRRTRPVFRWKNLLMTREDGKDTPTALYRLVKKVFLDVDKTMLPDKSAMTQAAARGYKSVIASILQRRS